MILIFAGRVQKPELGFWPLFSTTYELEIPNPRLLNNQLHIRLISDRTQLVFLPIVSVGSKQNAAESHLLCDV